MALTLNGTSNTISGLAVGGLPDGVVDNGCMADDAIDSSELADGCLDSVHLASGVGGKILQVKSTTKSDTFTTSSSSFTDVTGLSVAITPASASNKVLVTAVIQYSTDGSGGSRQCGRILRSDGSGTSALATGSSAGNRLQASFGSETSGGGGNMKSATITFLDSPGRTDEVTYKVQAAAVDGSDFKLNVSVSDTDVSSYYRVASHITAMEVSA